MGPELTKDYNAATDRDFWPLVSAHLVAASPFMLATRERNLDVDCRDIPVSPFSGTQRPLATRLSRSSLTTS